MPRVQAALSEKKKKKKKKKKGHISKLHYSDSQTIFISTLYFIFYFKMLVERQPRNADSPLDTGVDSTINGTPRFNPRIPSPIPSARINAHNKTIITLT